MVTVKVSHKFQVVIPKEFRESMGIKVGQNIQMISYGDRLELIPIKPIKEMRGSLKGIETSVKRDKDGL